jgi:hypothetical protein
MAWTSITMTNLISITVGTKVAPVNPVIAVDYIYEVILVSEPELGSYTLESESFGHKSITQKTKEQFLKDNWWADI